MIKKSLPQICPSCGGTLQVRVMHCAECDTKIEGNYPLSALQRFAQGFGAEDGIELPFGA